MIVRTGERRLALCGTVNIIDSTRDSRSSAVRRLPYYPTILLSAKRGRPYVQFKRPVHAKMVAILLGAMYAPSRLSCHQSWPTTIMAICNFGQTATLLYSCLSVPCFVKRFATRYLHNRFSFYVCRGNGV